MTFIKKIAFIILAVVNDFRIKNVDSSLEDTQEDFDLKMHQTCILSLKHIKLHV